MRSRVPDMSTRGKRMEVEDGILWSNDFTFKKIKIPTLYLIVEYKGEIKTP